jgi:hypothetical protein
MSETHSIIELLHKIIYDWAGYFPRKTVTLGFSSRHFKIIKVVYHTIF